MFFVFSFVCQVSYAAKDLRADIIVDVATLTGAQGISTGRYHAAVLCNREEWEQACVTSGAYLYNSSWRHSLKQ